SPTPPPLLPYTTLFRSDRNGIRAQLRPITPTHLSSSSSVDTSWCESPGKCWRVIHPISVMWTYLPSVTATTPLCIAAMVNTSTRSEEHTSELQSPYDLV